MKACIDARNLQVHCKAQETSSGVSFSCNQGEVIGIFGERGSGKSALFNTLTGMALADAGQLFVYGLNALESPVKVKSKIGIIAKKQEVDGQLPLFENLLVYAVFQGFSLKSAKKRVRSLLRRFGLDEMESQSMKELTELQVKKFLMARALIHDPQLVLFDEPTTGLSHRESESVYRDMLSLKREGRSLIVFSRMDSTFDDFCDRCLLIHRGQVVLEGRASDLIRENIGHMVIEFNVRQADVDYYALRVKENYEYLISGTQLYVFLKENQSYLSLIKQISSKNISVRRAALSDVYLKHLGRELRRL